MRKEETVNIETGAGEERIYDCRFTVHAFWRFLYALPHAITKNTSHAIYRGPGCKRMLACGFPLSEQLRSGCGSAERDSDAEANARCQKNYRRRPEETALDRRHVARDR